MKNILISTDFSANATHAAVYGYNLATQLKANIMLTDAVAAGAGMAQAAIDEDDVLMDACTDELQKLKLYLQQNECSDTFRPQVDCVINKSGVITDRIDEAIGKDAGLVVTAKYNGNTLNSFLPGSLYLNLIDTTSKPLLIVPPEAPVKVVKKIAFATDLYSCEKDLPYLYFLVKMAKETNADILLTHVDTRSNHSRALQLMADQLMAELSNTANYPRIYYRTLKDNSTENGLDWLCEHGQIDILAMNHSAYTFIDSVLNLSHTQNMATRIRIPLLVFPWR